MDHHYGVMTAVWVSARQSEDNLNMFTPRPLPSANPPAGQRWRQSCLRSQRSILSDSRLWVRTTNTKPTGGVIICDAFASQPLNSSRQLEYVRSTVWYWAATGLVCVPLGVCALPTLNSCVFISIQNTRSFQFLLWWFEPHEGLIWNWRGSWLCFPAQRPLASWLISVDCVVKWLCDCQSQAAVLLFCLTA